MTDSGTLGATTGTISPTVVTNNNDQVAPNSPEQQPASSNNDVPADCSRVQLNEADWTALSSSDWAGRWRLQEAYINSLEQRLHRQEGEVSELQQREQRQRCQLGEAQQREKVLVRRLTAKEQEMHDLVHQLAELKTTPILPTTLRSSYLDPAVNTLYTLLRSELHAAKSRLEDTQHELAAWKFTPDSNTGKRLMAKCRLLHQENEELGRMTSSGRIAMLEGELALQKGFSEEVRQSQTELESFLADLEEDVEGMQSTIMLLQGELRRCKEQLQSAEKDISDLRTQLQDKTSPSPTPTSQQNGCLPSTVVVCANGENNNSALPVTVTGLTINGDVVITDEDTKAPEQTDDVEQGRTKRLRRSSDVLSIDYDDDDDGVLVITSNGDIAMSDAD